MARDIQLSLNLRLHRRSVYVLRLHRRRINVLILFKSNVGRPKSQNMLNYRILIPRLSIIVEI